MEGRFSTRFLAAGDFSPLSVNTQLYLATLSLIPSSQIDLRHPAARRRWRRPSILLTDCPRRLQGGEEDEEDVGAMGHPQMRRREAPLGGGRDHRSLARSM